MSSVDQLSSGSDQVCFRAIFPYTTPSQLFLYLVEPLLLTKWWPQEAFVEAKPGGSYHLSWRTMNWDLRGEYLVFELGRALEFTWR